jgi:hypothetical protein
LRAVAKGTRTVEKDVKPKREFFGHGAASAQTLDMRAVVIGRRSTGTKKSRLTPAFSQQQR